MGTWECMKLGELPWHNTLGVLCWGRSLKIQVEIKREVFMLEVKEDDAIGAKIGNHFFNQLLLCSFLHFVKIQIRNAFNGMLECLEVGHIQFMTDFLCSISKLVCPPSLPLPPTAPPTLWGISIYDLYLKVLMFKQMLTF
jgi:hypothetical protein